MKLKENKTLKVGILSSLVTAIVTSTVCVTAVSLSARDIGFTSTDENWKATNVNDAMNDIYNVASTSKGKIYTLGKGRNFNIGDIVGNENVGNYTADNFLIDWGAPTLSTQKISTVSGQASAHIYQSLSKASDWILSYDNTTGELTITGGTYSLVYNMGGSGSATYSATPTVYFIENFEFVSE